MSDRDKYRARMAVELGMLKPQWEAHCRRTGVTPSEALRTLVGQALGSAPRAAYGACLVDTDLPRQRVEIRLTQGEYAALREVARAAGFSANRWIVAMLRAQITAQPQFGESELAVLAESNTQLAAIGRNLNQIARALNSQEMIEPYRFKILQTLKVEVDEHLDTVTAVIRANLDRWSRGVTRMPYPKRYVDGMLLNWGDRLFYEPVYPIKAPRTSRVAWRGTPAQLRAQIARTIRRAPEVMIKITNKPGGKKGMTAIRDHLRYISRNGQVGLEDQDGQAILGVHELKDVVDEWRHSGMGIPDESRHREAFNIMLSMPPGTDRQAVRDAARAFAKTEFGENHRYVFAAHEDEAHPHVHLCVQARGRHGRRLNPRKADLQRWREGFAEHLREHGVEANATPRRTRGVTQRYAKQAVVHLRERGESSENPSPSSSATFDAHRRILDAWHEVGRALAASDSGADRLMSIDVTDFVRQMPAVQAGPAPNPEFVQKSPLSPVSKTLTRHAPPPLDQDEPDIEH